MINILRQKNETLIKTLPSVGDSKSLKKQMVIKTLLSNDDCFFKISMEDALNLILSLGYSQIEAFKIYKKLTSSSEFIKK